MKQGKIEKKNSCDYHQQESHFEANFYNYIIKIEMKMTIFIKENYFLAVFVLINETIPA